MKLKTFISRKKCLENLEENWQIREIENDNFEFTGKNAVLSLDRKSGKDLQICEIEHNFYKTEKKNIVLSFDRKSGKHLQICEIEHNFYKTEKKYCIVI